MNHSTNIIYMRNMYDPLKPVLKQYLGKDITEYIVMKYVEFGKYNYYCCECAKYYRKANKMVYCSCSNCGKHYCIDCINNSNTSDYYDE